MGWGEEGKEREVLKTNPHTYIQSLPKLLHQLTFRDVRAVELSENRSTTPHFQVALKSLVAGAYRDQQHCVGGWGIQ